MEEVSLVGRFEGVIFLPAKPKSETAELNETPTTYTPWIGRGEVPLAA